MIQIAGGILLAFFVLAFLPELIRLAIGLIKVVAIIAAFALGYILLTGNW